MSVVSKDDMFNAQNSALINKTRQKLKRTFSKLDDNGTGQVHKDAFFHTLKHFNIEINSNDRHSLKRAFDNLNGYLPYNNLIKNLTLNVTTHEWGIKNLNQTT